VNPSPRVARLSLTARTALPAVVVVDGVNFQEPSFAPPPTPEVAVDDFHHVEVQERFDVSRHRQVPFLARSCEGS